MIALSSMQTLSGKQPRGCPCAGKFFPHQGKNSRMTKRQRSGQKYLFLSHSEALLSIL